MSNPFNKIHAAMAALPADDRAAYETVLDSTKRSATAGSELTAAYHDVAFSIAEAMACFIDRGYAAAVNCLSGLVAHGRKHRTARSCGVGA